MPRPKAHDAALRVRLLDRAGRTLSEHGLDGLSLRRLATDVGTSTTAVYSLFGGKPALLAAVFGEAFDRFARHLGQVHPSPDPAADLAALGRAYRASALADPHFYEVMFGPSAAAVPRDAAVGQRAAATFTPLVDAVGRAMDAGVLRPADPAVVSATLWATVHGVVSLELRGLLPAAAGDPAAVFDAAMRAQLDGWRPGR